MIFFLITMWMLSGMLLAGFLYGPYFYKHNDTSMKWKSMLCGITLGPFTIGPIIMLYTEFWSTIGQIYWKSVI